MATSSFPAARAALYTTLQTAFGPAGTFGPDGVLVTYGAPLTKETEFVSVINGAGKQETAVLGRGHPRDEDNKTYVIVHTENGDPADTQTPLERVFALMGAVEDALRADPSLDGAVRVAQLTGWELDEGQTVESRSCTLALNVRLQQRI